MRAAALVLVAVLTGCGEEGPRRPLPTTPGAELVTPTPEPTARPRDPRMTRADAERLRPVIAAWGKAMREAKYAAAAEFFEAPAIIAQNGRVLELASREEIEAYLSRLPCGARLEEVQQDGRYVVGTFTLTERPGGACGSLGELVRVAFVFSGRRFTEWWQVPGG
jgi:hypothetical protein